MHSGNTARTASRTSNPRPRKSETRHARPDHEDIYNDETHPPVIDYADIHVALSANPRDSLYDLIGNSRGPDNFDDEEHLLSGTHIVQL